MKDSDLKPGDSPPVSKAQKYLLTFLAFALSAVFVIAFREFLEEDPFVPLPGFKPRFPREVAILAAITPLYYVAMLCLARVPLRVHFFVFVWVVFVGLVGHSILDSQKEGPELPFWSLLFVLALLGLIPHFFCAVLCWSRRRRSCEGLLYKNMKFALCRKINLVWGKTGKFSELLIKYLTYAVMIFSLLLILLYSQLTAFPVLHVQILPDAVVDHLAKAILMLASVIALLLILAMLRNNEKNVAAFTMYIVLLIVLLAVHDFWCFDSPILLLFIIVSALLRLLFMVGDIVFFLAKLIIFKVQNRAYQRS